MCWLGWAYEPSPALLKVCRKCPCACLRHMTIVRTEACMHVKLTRYLSDRRSNSRLSSRTRYEAQNPSDKADWQMADSAVDPGSTDARNAPATMLLPRRRTNSARTEHLGCRRGEMGNNQRRGRRRPVMQPNARGRV